MDTTPSNEHRWHEAQRASRTILIVDIVESVRLLELDESGVIERWRRFVGEVRSHVIQPGIGRLVKSLGDGMLLEYESVPAAVSAALDIQHRIKPYNGGLPEALAIQLRIGLNRADVVIDELDVYGRGVNLAARLASIAPAGGIVASPDVREACLDGIDASFTDLGEVYLKHIAGPVHAVSVAPIESVPQTPLPAEGQVSGAPALAVLHFTGPNTTSDALGALIADGICSRASASEEVQVISRLSSSHVSGRGMPLDKLCGLLKCQYLLGGRWSSWHGKVHLHVELVDGLSNAVLWSQRMVTSETELLDPEDPVTAFIARECVAAVTQHQLRHTLHAPLPSLRSFSLQLAATTLMHRSPLREFYRGGEVLEHLAERHPRSVKPRAWLAQWHVLRVTRNLAQDVHQEAVRALQHTRRALDEDPECALALAMEGFVQCHIQKDLDAADERLDLALRYCPNQPLAWLFRCVVLGFRGEGDAAWKAAERAITLSPLDPMRHYFDALAASAALAAGLQARAVELALSSLRINRNHLPTLRALTIAQAELGHMADASASAQRVLQLDPTFTVAGYVAGGPKGSEATRQRYAKALNQAGVPMR